MECGVGVSARISSLYTSSMYHDIEFHVQDTCTSSSSPLSLPSVVLRAHRLILATSSHVFQALCYGPLADKCQVHVTDIDPQAFEVMLRYIYTDNIHLTSAEVASHVLFAAKKYLVKPLIALTVDYLAANLSDDNCIDVYNLAEGLEEKHLSRLAFQHICRRLIFVKDLICSENLSTNLLEALVTSEHVNGEEATLVNIAHMWAQDACTSLGLTPSPHNMRHLLLQHNILHNIRWPLVVQDEQHQLVTEAELSEARDDKRSSCPLRPCAVYMTPACEFWQMQRDMCEGTCVTTSVCVNQSVMVQSVMLMGGAAPCSNNVPVRGMCDSYTERLHITISCNNKRIHSQTFQQSVSYQLPFQLQLQDHVILRQDQLYDISVQTLVHRNNSLFCPFTSKSIRNPLGLSVSCTKVVATDNAQVNSSSFIAGFIFGY